MPQNVHHMTFIYILYFGGDHDKHIATYYFHLPYCLIGHDRTCQLYVYIVPVKNKYQTSRINVDKLQGYVYHVIELVLKTQTKY